MKKLSYLLSMMALAGMVFLASCGKDEDPDPDPISGDACDSLTFPTATGDATIEVLNFSSSTIEVEAGNVLALAVQVTKGSSRTKKLRLFASDCINSLGTEVDLSDQPKGGKNGIDLRNTDNPQIRNVNYAVPTGMDPIYLTIQIDEGGGNTNYKQLTLNVSGSGIIDTWSDVILGGNTNSNASRMASGTGQTYTACNAAENIDYIDITHAVASEDGGTTYNSYLCSNPQRFKAPISLSVSTVDCGDDGTKSTDGGNASYFKAYSGSVSFDAVTEADLAALTISTSDPEYATVSAVGDVFEFLSNDGRKGLIKVTGEDATYGLGDGRGYATVTVKIQR